VLLRARKITSFTGILHAWYASRNGSGHNHNKSGLMLDHEGTAAAAVLWQYFMQAEDG
jgi:hypothetical protein